jgi:hypothetical protein
MARLRDEDYESSIRLLKEVYQQPLDSEASSKASYYAGFRLVNALSKAGKHDAAVEIIADLKSRPNRDDFRLDCAAAQLSFQKNEEGAAARYKELADRWQPSDRDDLAENVFILRDVAQLCFDARDPARAVKYAKTLERATETRFQHHELHGYRNRIWVAKLYASIGSDADARRVLDSVDKWADEVRLPTMMAAESHLLRAEMAQRQNVATAATAHAQKAVTIFEKLCRSQDARLVRAKAIASAK